MCNGAGAANGNAGNGTAAAAAARTAAANGNAGNGTAADRIVAAPVQTDAASQELARFIAMYTASNAANSIA